MGLQDEYLRNFTVLMTEKGVVPLTDPMQIAVYNSLCAGLKRPSDIATELGVPSSSLHFVLDKMVDAGIIIRSKPDPDKKSVYYSNLALKIAGSFEPDDAAKEEAEDTFNDPARYYSGMSSVANMLDSYTSEIGLDMDRMRANYASDLADAVRDRIGKCGMEDAIVRIMKEFSDITGFKFSVFALNPLTLVFEGDRCMRSKVDMLATFVVRAIENSTGRTYHIVGREDFSNGELARVKVSFDRAEKIPEPYINMSLPQTSEVHPFMMVDLDGTAGLMTSSIQIDIVDAVYERPLCITDIVNKVNSPRSTITSNLLRMVEEGVISVFYSESGSAYYGLSCSILMKKTRPVNRDSYEISMLLGDVSARKGAFMEGYLRYTMTTLKNYGFDSDYMMVVLGAKYMRAAGRGQPKNFDIFFGKMSDIAKTIGLSLNVVSVYPLTIGINNDNADSEMSSAMTFVKGMAHQGLEMASSGIFVRSSEDTPETRNISFREIYPALSMTPVEGIRVEELADAAPAKKKRTSSVKTALKNRSAKENGRPARTVRYITGVVMLVFVAAILLISAGGDDNSADGDTFTVYGDAGFSDFALIEDDGTELQIPLSVDANTQVSFTILSDSVIGIGTVSNGVATAMQPDSDGRYTITVSSDLELQTLYPVSLPETGNYTAYIYSFDDKVSEKYAYNFAGYIDAVTYAEVSGGLWVNSHGAVKIQTDDGFYISDTEEKTDSVFIQKIVSLDPTVPDFHVREIKSNFITIDFSGDYIIDGRYVSGELKVGMWKQIAGLFVSTDGPVTITSTDASGDVRNINLTEGKFRFYTGNEDLKITFNQKELI